MQILLTSDKKCLQVAFFTSVLLIHFTNPLSNS